MPLWLDTRFGTRNAPEFYLALFVFAALLILKNPYDSLSYLKNQYFIWCLVLIFMFAANLLRLKYGDYSIGSYDIELNRLQIFLMAPVIGFIITRLEFKYLKPFFLFLPVICTTIILFDFLNPGAVNYIHEIKITIGEGTRVAGPWRNANIAGEATVLALIVCGILFKRPNYLLATIYLYAGLAMIVTGSRAGLIGYLLVGIFLLITRRLPLVTIIIPIYVALNIAQLLDQVEIAAADAGRELGIKNLRDRLEFVTGTKDLDDASSESRTELFQNSLKESFDKPIFGHAVNYQDIKSNSGTHNMATSFFYTYGIFGLAMWLWLAFSLLSKTKKRRLDCIAASIAFIWFSMFTHNMLANVFWLIFFALFAVYFGNEQIHSQHLKTYGVNYSSKERSLKRRKRRKRKRN